MRTFAITAALMAATLALGVPAQECLSGCLPGTLGPDATYDPGREVAFAVDVPPAMGSLTLQAFAMPVIRIFGPATTIELRLYVGGSNAPGQLVWSGATTLPTSVSGRARAMLTSPVTTTTGQRLWLAFVVPPAPSGTPATGVTIPIMRSSPPPSNPVLSIGMSRMPGYGWIPFPYSNPQYYAFSIECCYPPTIVVQPEDVSVCASDTAQFATYAAGTLPVSYQWQRDGRDMLGETQHTLRVVATAALDGATFRCRIWNFCSPSIYTRSALLRVSVAPVIRVQPQGATQCEGSRLVLAVDAVGAGLSYRWRKDGVTLQGETAPTLVRDPLARADAGDYDVIVGNSCGTIPSGVAHVEVLQTLAIVRQPADAEVCANHTAHFELSATGSPAVAYQWRRDGVAIAGATRRILEFAATPADDGRLYDCLVSNPCRSELSRAARLTVMASPTVDCWATTPTSGCAPLRVQFQSSAPGPVVALEWDFDGDGIVDSSLRNPEWTYEAGNPGGRPFTVSLTARFATGCATTRTLPDYVHVFGPVADFTASVTGGSAPLTVAFTDTSSTTAVLHEWDFDGDGLVDSTLRNPIAVYAEGGWFTPQLTVHDAQGCRGRVALPAPIHVLGPTRNRYGAEYLHLVFDEVRGTTTANVASLSHVPPQLAVTGTGWQADAGRGGFQGNDPGFGCLGHGDPPPWIDTGLTFDAASAFTLSWWQRTSAPRPSSQPDLVLIAHPSLEVYVDGVSGTLRAKIGPPRVELQTSIDLFGMPGVWRHVAVVWDGVNRFEVYIDGQPDAGRNWRSIQGGAGLLTIAATTSGHAGMPFTQLFDLDDIRLYDHARSAAQLAADVLAEPPYAASFGRACPGTRGAPWIRTRTAPAIPAPDLAVELRSVEPGRPAALLVGITATSWQGMPLPIDLGVFGFCAGSPLEVAPLIALPASTGVGAADEPLPIPAEPTLAGLHLYFQWLIAGTIGAASPGLDVHLH
ncbi:MAG: hypothetical protein IPM29_28115 [Planctomycetes bacterium]|nr:hypothetical protein [Planctomycetota bacterium]